MSKEMLNALDALEAEKGSQRNRDRCFRSSIGFCIQTSLWPSTKRRSGI